MGNDYLKIWKKKNLPENVYFKILIIAFNKTRLK